jgi:hypothetical protein
MKRAVLIATLFLCTQAHADEASKRAKIGKLIAVQGMEQMFKQQLDSSKTAMVEMGTKIVRSMSDENTPPSASEKLVEPIFNRFVEDVGNMFTARELVDRWSSQYGKELTEADIDKILAYYSSPIGQKDVKASQMAMVGFSATVNTETEKRAMKLLEKLKVELTAAMPK